MEENTDAAGSILQHASGDGVRCVTLISYLAGPEGSSTCAPAGRSESLIRGQI